MNVFKKIFLSFWAALVLEIIISVIFYPPAKTTPSPMVTNATLTALRTYGELAIHEFDTKGTPGVKAYAQELASSAGVQLYLIDRSGNDIGGREVPALVREFLKARVASRYDPQQRLILVTTALSYVPAPLQAVGLFLEGGEPPRPAFESLLSHVVILIITSGIVCFFLARYLTAPIVELRSAVHRLARGELQARVETATKRRDEIAELVFDFNRMAERIQSLVAAQHRLIADISHELRTPLARLSIAAGILRQKTSPEAAGMIDRVERETERLNALIGQLLTLSTLESKTTPLEFAVVEFDSLVREVIDDAQLEATERDSSIVVQGLSPTFVEGDVELLRRAVENVVRNAIRYTKPGTSVDVGMEKLLEFRQEVVKLTVRDHGTGVAENEVRKIFLPFYTIADARDRKAGGIGLGLAITDRALRLHGGSVRAFNAEGGGLAIELRIPLASEVG